MSEREQFYDPFLEPRGCAEQAANDIMREFFLTSTPASTVYREDAGGYALIMPHSSGARVLTVPAANEADFMFHGNAGEGGHRLAEFIAKTAIDSRADHVKLPLLSKEEARFLRDQLAERLPDWLWAEAFSAVAPLASRTMQESKPSFRRAMARAEKAGIVLQRSRSFDLEEVRRLHERRWGVGNRGKSFFDMIAVLVAADCTEFFTARDRDGVLRGAQLDILGTRTRHFYYSVSDKHELAGVGTALMGASWRGFVEAGNQSEYSFGRGTERYKYRYADSYRSFFELRGFYVPLREADRPPARSQRVSACLRS